MSFTKQSATELLAALRQNKISPLELAEEHLREIERQNPELNAVVDCDPERVRAQAGGDLTGPLAGLPVTVKSSISTAGHRCEIGSVLNRGNIPAEDAVVVERLRRAGAVILGTTELSRVPDGLRDRQSSLWSNRESLELGLHRRRLQWRRVFSDCCRNVGGRAR